MDGSARWRAPDCADTDSYMNHFYRNVPTSATSRAERMEEGKIFPRGFRGVLLDTDQATHQDGADISGANATEYGL